MYSLASSHLCALVIWLVISLTKAQLYNPDYSEKVSVRVSEILKQTQTPEDRSWPPPNSQDYAQVNMRILGKAVDPTIVNNLKPDVSKSKERKLLKILGDDYDKEWTSVEHPPSTKQARSSLSPLNKWDPKLAVEVRRLNMTMHDANGVYILPAYIKDMFQEWLLSQATCEMEYLWEDLGPLFWPRWIRRGVCLNTARHSCSWPPGMKCRTSGSRALKLLHWKCVQQDSLSPAASPTEGGAKPKRKRDSRGGRNGRMQSDEHLRRRRRRRQRRKDQGADVPSGKGDKAYSENKRKKRTRRLIRRLSVTEAGYHCQWQIQKYLISDKCTCSCT